MNIPEFDKYGKPIDQNLAQFCLSEDLYKTKMFILQREFEAAQRESENRRNNRDFNYYFYTAGNGQALEQLAITRHQLLELGIGK